MDLSTFSASKHFYISTSKGEHIIKQLEKGQGIYYVVKETYYPVYILLFVYMYAKIIMPYNCNNLQCSMNT